MFYQLKKLLKKAKEADYAEISLFKSQSSAVSGEKNQIKGIDFLDTSKVFVRVWIGKKQGTAFSNSLDETVVNKAIKTAKCSRPLELFYGLPAKQPYKQVRGIYNSMPDEEEMLSLAKQTITNVADKKRGSSLAELNLGKSVDRHFLVNSEGIEAVEKTTDFELDIAATAKKSGQIALYEDSLIERKLPDIAYFAKSIKEEALGLIDAKSLKEKISTVILSPLAFADLLENAFLENFNAVNVIKNRSLFAKKLKKQIVSKEIILRDNGSLTGGTKSSVFDFEGTPTQNTKLIEKGILHSFIHDYNTAKHFKTMPTGNVSAQGIDFNNIILEPGRKDIISSAINGKEKTLLINSLLGAHTANETTTAFSVKTHAAYLLGNGRKQAVKNVMLSGKIVEALQNVAAIDNKVRNVCGFYLPAIALKGINVTAG